MRAILLALLPLAAACTPGAIRPAPVAPPAPAVASTPTTAPSGMVSAADPRAVAAGVEILRAGGNATDAAIATMLALGVVEPQSSGLGGGSFWVRQAAGGGLDTIDARETAPMAAGPRLFYTPAGQPMDHGEAVPGGKSVGVPGALRGMALAHRTGGKLAWAQLFGPAIRLAKDGWQLSPRFVDGLARNGGHIVPELRAIFSPGGTPLPAGATVRNPAQAALLERLAARGADSFYVGPDAQALVATVRTARRNPSQMTAGDLASYQAKPRDPVCVPYRAYRICGMGPPSSGGLTVLMILKQLERFDLGAMGKDSATAWHLFAESSRLAYADRNLYIGDPDYVRVPVAGMLDPAYLASRSALISPTATMASFAAGTPPGAPQRTRAEPAETPGTTSLSVADRAGNVVAVTTTIEGVYGSGLTVNGIVLNNELTDFDTVPAKDGYLVANRVEGGKRPRSSMAPTIVYDAQGRVRLAVGAAGGPTIIAQIAKAVMGVVDFGMSAQDAIAMGLLYAPGMTAAAEAGTERAAMVPALQALGERVEIRPLGLKANAVEWVGGRWAGGADPRSEGVAGDESGAVTTIRRVGKDPTRPPE
ncbi:gamma-glutamyltransferase [Sphingomonas sp. RS2018]